MLKYLVEGGFMMVPLAICSILTLAVIVDRAMAFAGYRAVDNRSLRAQILELLSLGDFTGAARLCASTTGPVAAVLLAGLQSYHRHGSIQSRSSSITTVVEKSMEDYSAHALGAVETRLGILSTVGNAAPLFGMAGTVLGMIKAFGNMAAAGGLEGAAVAGGISEALVTTAAGLLIALAAVIPYNYFTGLSDRIALDIDEAATELIDFVATRAAAGEDGHSVSDQSTSEAGR